MLIERVITQTVSRDKSIESGPSRRTPYSSTQKPCLNSTHTCWWTRFQKTRSCGHTFAISSPIHGRDDSIAINRRIPYLSFWNPCLMCFLENEILPLLLRSFESNLWSWWFNFDSTRRFKIIVHSMHNVPRKTWSWGHIFVISSSMYDHDLLMIQL